MPKSLTSYLTSHLKKFPLPQYPDNNKRVRHVYRQQSGFTLVELMVAMTIFAMLTVAGWQVFDTLTRAKDRANIHANYLSELQYMYLQLKNDTNQIVAWDTVQNETYTKEVSAKKEDPSTPDPSKPDPNKPNEQDDKSNDADSEEVLAVKYTIPDFMKLTTNSLSFIRFLDPDPRYKNSATIGQVSYSVQGNALMRLQADQYGGNEISSVLLEDVDQLSWQALMPEPVANFSSSDASEDTSGNSYKGKEEPQLLPKGIKLNFVYQDMPIEWVFALPKASPNMAK